MVRGSSARSELVIARIKQTKIVGGQFLSLMMIYREVNCPASAILAHYSRNAVLLSFLAQNSNDNLVRSHAAS